MAPSTIDADLGERSPGEEPCEVIAAELAAANYLAHSRAPASLRAYAHDWQDFLGWCAQHRLAPCPASPWTVGLYLAHLAERLRPATLQRRLAAIVVEHRRVGAELDTKAPDLAEVWRGIRRVKGTAKQGKSPILTAELAGIVGSLPATLAGQRDRAVLLVMFAAALRRSELVALRCEDLTWTSEGVLVHLVRSKTDLDAQGEIKAVPRGRRPDTCPVAALKAWVMAARLEEGALFRAIDAKGHIAADGICDRTVARIVKRAVENHGTCLGLSRAEIAARVKEVSSHSLRAGFATSAAAAGAAEWEIMRQTGHRKRESVQGYIRAGTAFRGHVGHRLGL
jgi:integrase